MNSRARATRLVVLGVLAMGLFAPMGASASHCSDRLVIFSRNNRAPTSINSNAVSCEVFDHDYDGRLINPGSNLVSIRLTIGESTCQVANPAEGIPAETRGGLLTGLGADEDFTLTCTYDSTLDFHSFNASAWIGIDATAQGCITATVPSEDESTSFHTIDQVNCF